MKFKEVCRLVFESKEDRELAGKILINAGMNGIEKQMDRWPTGMYSLEFASAEALLSAIEIIEEEQESL